MDTPATGSAAPGRGTSNLTYGILAGVAIVGVIFAFSGSAFMPNNWYSLFKAVHVLGAVIWVGGGVSIMIHAIRGQRAYKPEDIVTVAKQAAFMGEKVFAPVGLITFLMGIAMMINTNLGWGHFWIVAGLIGYASTFIVGIAILSPMAKKIDESAERNGPTHPETIALIERIMLIARFDVAVLMLVVLDMVTKPFA
ncbi:MAG TPA: DUF2269 family protein [Gaiellaceae bacterium]|nr:DUF2269 family protein [Gaiellaceae bacterium]